MEPSERLRARCDRLGSWVDQLSHRNAHLNQLLNSLPVITLLTDSAFNLLAFSGAAKHLLEIEDSHLHRSIFGLPCLKEDTQLELDLNRLLSGESTPQRPNKMPDGEFYQRYAEIANGEGKVRLTWQPQNTVDNTTDLLRQIIDHMPHEIYAKDSGGHFILVNEAMAKANDTTVEDLTGKHLTAVLSDPVQLRRALQEDQHVIQTGQTLYSERTHITDKKGRDRFVQTTKLPIVYKDSGLRAVLGLSVDITEQRRAESALKRRSLYDHLTDLPNRNLFTDRLEHALETSRRQGAYTFSLLLLDLDNFKDVNDSQGHGTGDAILVEVSRRLQCCIRPGDTVARLGGDEFAILLNPMNTEKGANVVANRIHRAIGTVFQLEQTRHFLSTSIGIATPTGSRDSAEHLIRNADVAMYHAKRTGPGKTEQFRPQMHMAARQRTQMTRELRDALHHKQFRLNYQPIVNLQTGRLSGMEALIRWAHPNRGMIPPSEFLPIAESSGAMPALEAWVVVEACRQMRRWQDELQLDVPLKISLNISADRLSEEYFVDHIQAILKEYDLAPNGLTVELTESSLIENPTATRNTLTRLRSMKIKVALDDFGTGFSSLSHLHCFPMDALKVDKSFTQYLHKNDNRSHIVRATVSLGQSLGLSVTAEGIETKEQLVFLQALGCDLGQGYYFSRPLPPEEFEALLRDDHTWDL